MTPIFFFYSYFFYLFILFFWLCWVFVSVRGLSLVAASGGHSSSRCGDRSSSRCAGLSLSRPLPLRGTGSRCAGSVVVAHGPSWSAARGIFPDQGSNPCPLHWQADSQPLRHQGSPGHIFIYSLEYVLRISILSIPILNIYQLVIKPYLNYLMYCPTYSIWFNDASASMCVYVHTYVNMCVCICIHIGHV